MLAVSDRDTPEGRARALKHANRLLDSYRPAIDQLTDMQGAATFLGLAYNSIQRMRHLPPLVGSGRPVMAPPDQIVSGRYPVWSYRTLVLHWAQRPGLGGPGVYRTRWGKKDAHV
jgi:hypothetical protein